MKRLSLFISLVLLAHLSVFAERVSPETAQKVALTFLNNKGAKASQLVDLSKEAGFANLYIFNGKECHVIMSADDRIEPILGYSLTNVFESKDMPENLKWWLQGYDSRIAEAIEQGETADEETRQRWSNLISGLPPAIPSQPTKAVSPIISTLWHQDTPFNNLCPPNTVTGCVATAMAQVMKKWNYPEIGIGSHSYLWNNDTYSANFGNTVYDWDNMIDSYNVSYSEDQANAVAKLLYHCGIAVEMKYLANNESASTIRRAGCALSSYFHYSSTYIEKKDFADDNAWISRLKDDLDQDMPLLYGGSYQNQDGGHAFVCDGYDSDNKLHFNWGWKSGSTGYYTVNGHSFTRAQNAVVNIKPIDCLAQKPSELVNVQLSGHQVTLSWNAGSNATSYNIYRNNTLIANSTSTSFVDDNPSIGINSYYIRSKDLNGSLSLPSNTLDVTVSFATPTVNHVKVQCTDNQASVSWPTPWWHPQNNAGVLAYTDESRTNLDWYLSWNQENLHLYWGIRHPAADLVSLQGKALYKTSFYVFYPGNYKVLVYQGTNTEEGSDLPANLVAEKVINTAAIGWVEADFDNPVFINDQDVWVFIYDVDGKFLWLPYNNNENCTGYGQYYAGDLGEDYTYLPHQWCGQLPINDGYKLDWFIRSYVTDDLYTYNLYDGSTKVNVSAPISDTYYDVNNPTNGIHQYTVKTYYNGIESAASNTASLTIGSESLSDLELGEDDAMTITEGSTLTVTGAITNSNPENLVIEDGGQLIHANHAVNATMRKTINAYSQNPDVCDGWYTIASPVNNDSVSLATLDDYDLYAYEEKGVMWRNQKNAANNITYFHVGEGLLYANSRPQSLAFAGEMQATNATVTVPLSFSSDNEALKGFNLVGNPFSRNLTYGDITLGGSPLTTYYVVEGGSQLVTRNLTETPIKPGQGFLVQASASNQNLVFNPSSKGQTDPTPAYLHIEAGNERFTDHAYVQFGQGNTLHKMTLTDKTTQLSLRYDNADYAAVNLDIIGDGACTVSTEIPINFKATENGTYTLTISGTPHSSLLTPHSSLLTPHSSLLTPHLIDNMTGANIDLLATPTYTFEAKTTDYESRFRLVFSANDDTDNPDNTETGDPFAFIDADGNLIVHGDGVLQIVDATGRNIVDRRDGACTVSTANMVPGVYVLRLITDNGIKTQKIIK